MLKIIIERHRDAQRDQGTHHLYLSQRAKATGGLQDGRLPPRNGQQGHRDAQHGIVYRVVTPRKRDVVQKRTDNNTKHKSQDSSNQAPHTDNLDVVGQLVGLLVDFRKTWDGTKRYAEVGAEG